MSAHSSICGMARALVMLESKTHAHRDVLFASGCGLVGFGLFPFLHARYFTWYYERMASGSSDTSELFESEPTQYYDPGLILNPSTNTAFDAVTCSMGVAFSLMGIGVMFISCLVLPRHSTRVCLKTIGVPLFVAAAGAAMLVYGFYTDSDVARAWHANAVRSFSDNGAQLDGSSLERQVNVDFCRALGDRVCQDSSLADAKELFTKLHKWPNADVKTPISRVCRQNPSVNSSGNMRVCRVCSSIARDPMGQQSDKLSLIKSPTQDAIHWCGEYLSTWNADSNLAKGPFRQHRHEILSNWDDDDSPVSLSLNVRLLVVLVWFSLPSLVVMSRWYFVPEIEDWDWSAIAVNGIAMVV